MTYFYYQTSRRATFVSSDKKEIIRTIQEYVDRYNSEGAEHNLRVPREGEIKRRKNLVLILGYETDVETDAETDSDTDLEPETIEANGGVQFNIYTNALDDLAAEFAGDIERLKRGDLYKVTTPYDSRSRQNVFLPLELAVRLKKFALVDGTPISDDTVREKQK